MEYSVIVPIYNEQGNIAQLDKEIKAIMHKLSKDYEIIYINDGSKDNTLEELKKLHKVKIIDLNKNYGQATALNAGFREAEGDLIITMDGDLQNDPADIPRLLEKLHKEDLDVVAGWRKKRKDKSGIRILTRIGRLIRRVLIKDSVHDTGCTLRVYRKKAAKSLDLHGEMHRYILALLRWKGFKIGEVIVNHRKRISGKTKYGYDKAFKGFIDLLYIWFLDKYSQRPLHIFGLAGIGVFGIGMLIEAVLAFLRFYNKLDLSGSGWFLLGFFLIIGGLISFSFGIVIDLLLRIYHNTSNFDKQYYIRDIFEE